MIVSQAVLKRFDLDLFKYFMEWKGLDDVSQTLFAPPSIITLQIYVEERPEAQGGETLEQSLNKFHLRQPQM